MPCNCQNAGSIAQPKAQSVQPKANAAIRASAQDHARPAFASMRYTGPTSAATTGAVTGRQYKFAHTGAVVQVDPRDKAALNKIPHLRQI
jgi:hypothetical protein